MILTTYVKVKAGSES